MASLLCLSATYSLELAVLLVFGLAYMAKDILVLEKIEYLSSYVQMVAYCLVLLFLISSSIWMFSIGLYSICWFCAQTPLNLSTVLMIWDIMS